jgi:hypothetical protein
MAFPVHHGIKLAQNGFIENLHVEILSSDPVPLTAGRVWYNSTDKCFRQSTLDGVGAVVVRTFATLEEVTAAVAAEEAARIAADAAIQSELDATQAGAGLSAAGAYVAPVGSNYLGSATSLKDADSILDGAVKTVADNLATEISRATGVEDALDARLDTVEANYVKKDGTVAMTGDLNLDGNSIINVATPVASTDAANKGYVDTQIAALGNAFEYVGVVEGGADAGSALDLETLTQKSAGDYYKVSVAGYFKVGSGGTPFYANVGDGLVWNISSGVDKIDNTDSTVSGTASFIAVTGSADTGFVVDIDASFKGRMTQAETDIDALEAADIALDGRLDTVEAEVVALDGRLDTAESEIDSLQAADIALDGRLDTVEADLATVQANYVKKDGTVAFTGDQSMGGFKLTNVATATAGGDATNKTYVDGAVSAEESARIAADSAIQSELDTTQAGAGLETSGAYVAPVGSNYLGSATTLKNADSLLDTQIKSVADNVALAMTKSAFNALRYVTTTVTAVATHTITHGLGSQDIDFSLWIDRDGDGKFFNDIASVEIVDNNTVKVYLSVAKNIKIAITKMDAVA